MPFYSIIATFPVLWEGFASKICMSFFITLLKHFCYLKFNYLFLRVSCKITSDLSLASRGQQVSANPDITSLIQTVLHIF